MCSWTEMSLKIILEESLEMSLFRIPLFSVEVVPAQTSLHVVPITPPCSTGVKKSTNSDSVQITPTFHPSLLY